MTTIKPQSEFPLLSRFKEVFPITTHTIFAYNHVIYCDYKLPDHLIVHEETHHRQQDRDGLDYWIDNYLKDPKYRLEQEIEAYKNQLQSIKDRNQRSKIRIESARNLSSELYGNLLTFQEALTVLK